MPIVITSWADGESGIRRDVEGELLEGRGRLYQSAVCWYWLGVLGCVTGTLYLTDFLLTVTLALFPCLLSHSLTSPSPFLYLIYNHSSLFLLALSEWVCVLSELVNGHGSKRNERFYHSVYSAISLPISSPPMTGVPAQWHYCHSNCAHTNTHRPGRCPVSQNKCSCGNWLCERRVWRAPSGNGNSTAKQYRTSLTEHNPTVHTEAHWNHGIEHRAPRI